MNGLLVIDKPGGMTSRDVVNCVQKWFPRKTKIGHTGTLDPLATGVLVVCIGSATRLAYHVQAMPKTYRARFRFGATSTTDDEDGEITVNQGAVPPTLEQIAAIIPYFLGTIDQLPPAFSALKVSGRRAYDLARQGQIVALAARSVRVDAIHLHDYQWPFLDVEIDCGKGTYIRSIARDFGAKLGCGGMVQSLRRTRIGPFTTDLAIDLNASPAEAAARLLAPKFACRNLPRAILDAEAERRFRMGQVVDSSRGGEFTPGSLIALLNLADELIGLGKIVRDALVAPHLVLPR